MKASQAPKTGPRQVKQMVESVLMVDRTNLPSAYNVTPSSSLSVRVSFVGTVEVVCWSLTDGVTSLYPHIEMVDMSLGSASCNCSLE